VVTLPETRLPTYRQSYTGQVHGRSFLERFMHEPMTIRHQRMKLSDKTNIITVTANAATIVSTPHNI
jgi:hypothetical protein